MRRHVAPIGLFLALAIPVLAAAETQEYAVDPVHSGVGFKVRHLLATTPGEFNEYEGKLTLDPAKIAETMKIEAVIQTASIDTRNERRNKHLQSPDFFDAANHPQITFKSTGVKAAGENKYDVTGDLTMRGVTKPVTLTAEVIGVGSNPFTKTPMIGLDLNGKVNRKDYGINWQKQLDNGGVVLGDDVTIDVHIEATVEPKETEEAKS